MKIDAHVHLWRLDRGDYDWLTPEAGPIYRDFGLTDLEPFLLANDIDGAILVQAAPSLAETDYLLAEAMRSPSVVGVVGWVPLDATDACTQLDRFAASPLAVGIRPMLQDLAERDWILRPECDAALRKCAERGLVLDALIRPDQLETLHRLALRHPELPIVIDHAAKPDIAGAGFAPWADAIARVAAHGNVACKLSGLLTEAPPQADEDSLRPYFDHLLTCFGAERLLWGSDWPVLTLAADYGRWLTMTRSLLDGLSAGDRDAVLGGNAIRTYRPRMLQRSAALHLNPNDNVVVCCRAVAKGEVLSVDGHWIEAKDSVPVGHKLALIDLASGQKVLKYGVAIGSMIKAAGAGEWVHLHNMKSDFISAHTRETVGGDLG